MPLIAPMRTFVMFGLAIGVACAPQGGDGTDLERSAPLDLVLTDASLAEDAAIPAPDEEDGTLNDDFADATLPDETSDIGEVLDVDTWKPSSPATWKTIGLPFPQDFVFKGLWAPSSKALFVVGVGPIAYFFDGTQFSDLAPPSPPAVLNAAWADLGNLFAVGMHGHALHWKADSSWTTHVVPKAPTLYGVSGVAPDAVFAVGSGGAIFRWDGEAWRTSSVSGRRLLRGMCSDPDTGLWVVGSAGTVLHMEDGVFREMASPVVQDLSACAPGVIAVGSGGIAVRAGVGGVQSLGSVAYPDLTAVTSLPGGRAWAVGLDGQVVEFRPDGQVLLSSAASGKDLYAVHATSALSVWAVGEGGVAIRFNGSFWLPKATGVASTLYGFYAIGASRGLAVGAQGTAVLLEDGLFEPLETKTSADLFAVILTPDGEGTIVGAGGLILRYSAGSFEQVASPTRRDLFALVRDASGNLFASGDGVVLSQDQSGTWRVVLSTPEEDLRAVYALDGGHVFAVGKAGAAYRFDGKNWVRLSVRDIPLEGGGTVPFQSALYGVWASGPNDVWAVGERGFVLRSSGGPFEVLTADTDVTLRAVHGRRPKDVFLAGGGGVVLRYDGATLVRESTNTVATLYGIHATADGAAFAVGDAGTVLRREE